MHARAPCLYDEAMRSLLLSFVLLAACGDDGANRLPDAPPPDPDAAVDAAPDTPVTVTIRMRGVPVEDVDVYFQNPDQSVAAVVPTDANGVARAVVTPGGSVTAVRPFPLIDGVSSKELRTWLGVQPGDQLLLEAPFGPAASEATVTFNAPVDPEASSYLLYVGCYGFPVSMTGVNGSGGTPTYTMSVQNCATTDVLVDATHFDGTTHTYIYQPNVALTDGATIELTGTYATVPATTWTWTNLPAGVNELDFESRLVTPGGVMSELYASSIETLSGGATFTSPRPTIPGALSVTETILRDPDAQRTRHGIYDWGTTTFDLAGALLPDFTAPATFTASTRSVAWESSGGTAPDGVLLDLRVYQTAFKSSFRWHVLAPAGTTVALPAVPAALTDFAFAADDDAEINNLATIKVPGGYAALRSYGQSLDPYFAAPVVATTAAGRAQFAIYEVRDFVRKRQPRAWQRPSVTSVAP